jgi:predicted ribosomally synthesized peptide with SipW-like signal peptide
VRKITQKGVKMAKQKEERKNKKVLFGFLFLFVAVGIIVGSVFAYFSDVITGSGSATAGTLDLTGNFTLTQYNAAGVSQGTGNVANFNPGDVLNITGAATNVGNKSASVRCEFALSGDLVTNTGNNKVKVVAGTVTTAAAAESASALTPTSGNTYHTAVGILNGSGLGAESESGGVANYACAISAYFPSSAGNVAQDDNLSINSKIQGIQYRNNATPNWADVVTIPSGS